MASANRLLLALALALCLPACSDEAPGSPPSSPADAGTDARAGDGGGAASDAADSSAAVTIACFSGTPRTNEELLNACWPETVTAISKKAALPPGYAPGMTLPPLPQ